MTSGQNTMKGVAEDILRAVAVFGIAACLTAFIYAALTRIPLTHDDAYVLGLVVGVIVAFISLVTLVCERVWKKKVAAWIFVTLYGLLGSYAGFVYATAELFGPGLAVFIFGASLIIGTIEFVGLRRIRSLYFTSTGVSLAAAFVAMFLAVRP